MTNKDKKVLAIGELLVDFISEDYHHDLSEARKFNMFQGGSPANFCANLNWLGITSKLIASVGKDGAGKFLIQQLEHCGLDTSDITSVESLPTSLVLVAKSLGTPDFVAYRMADRFIKINQMDWLKEVHVLHTSAFALSLEPARTIILDAFKQASQEGLLLSIDWNYAPGIWTNGGGEKVFQDIISLNPLLKLSKDDYERFFGLTQMDVSQAKEYLGSLGLSFCCLTCGADGVWFKTKESEWKHLAANKIEKVLDTTGAGDAFWAGFISGFLSSGNYELGVENGLKTAAQKVAKVGPLYL